MRSIGFNAEECRKALESYAAEVEELMELVDAREGSMADRVASAQSQLKNLKQCLDRDHKLRQADAKQSKLTEVEAAVFAPAIHQACASLRVGVNSKPDARWIEELSSIELTIQSALSELETWPKYL